VHVRKLKVALAVSVAERFLAKGRFRHVCEGEGWNFILVENSRVTPWRRDGTQQLRKVTVKLYYSLIL